MNVGFRTVFAIPSMKTKQSPQKTVTFGNAKYDTCIKKIETALLETKRKISVYEKSGCRHNFEQLIAELKEKAAEMENELFALRGA